jgi:HlyD family secretion protein
MTVSVDIETAKKPDALVIPTGALHEPSSDAPWVLVVRNNHTVKQTVTLGLRGDENVEVLSGLATDEAVIPANLALIKADQRVRVTLLP